MRLARPSPPECWNREVFIGLGPLFLANHAEHFSPLVTPVSPRPATRPHSRPCLALRDLPRLAGRRPLGLDSSLAYLHIIHHHRHPLLLHSSTIIPPAFSFFPPPFPPCYLLSSFSHPLLEDASVVTSTISNFVATQPWSFVDANPPCCSLSATLSNLEQREEKDRHSSHCTFRGRKEGFPGQRDLPLAPPDRSRFFEKTLAFDTPSSVTQNLRFSP